MRTAIVVATVAIAACGGDDAATSETTAEPAQLAAKTPAEAPPPEPPPPAPPKPTGAYAAIAGTWIGTGLQYDNQSWAVEMTIDRPDAGVGEAIGRIEYPALDCGGFLIREPEANEQLVVREQLTHGIGRCIDNGTMRIPAKPIGGTLTWRWYMPNTGQEMAMATFVRR
jgi:hypothetical protein